jgi:glycosyltransferase involved in cell wall biosynthesis
VPRISVCIPSYNLAEHVGEAIASVLAQSFADFELLIEDDGSPDGSVAVIQSFADSRIALTVKAVNEGQNRTTNNLVSRAKGEYICLLGADDVWLPGKLAQQVAYMDAHPECGIVFGVPEFIDTRGAALGFPEGYEHPQNQSKEAWQQTLKTGNCLFISTSMYRNNDETFKEPLHLLADLEFYVRVVKNADLHVIQQPLAKIRMRDNKANLSAITTANLERHCDELAQIKAEHYPVDRSRVKLMIATPFYENKGYSPYIYSMFETVASLARHTKIEFCFQQISGGSYVDHTRNLLADAFLESDCSHLFFMDSDQSWDLQGFMNVLNADVEMVGAAYPVKNNWENYGVAIHSDENNVAIVKDGLIKAQKVPTGFMKIARCVFERIKAANPNDWYWDNRRKLQNYFGHITLDHVRYGEDISFNLRWQAVGGEIWVQPKVSMGHYGVQGWYGNYHKFLRSQPGGDLDPARKAA